MSSVSPNTVSDFVACLDMKATQQLTLLNFWKKEDLSNRSNNSGAESPVEGKSIISDMFFFYL